MYNVHHNPASLAARSMNTCVIIIIIIIIIMIFTGETTGTPGHIAPVPVGIDSFYRPCFVLVAMIASLVIATWRRRLALWNR